MTLPRKRAVICNDWLWCVVWQNKLAIPGQYLTINSVSLWWVFASPFNYDQNSTIRETVCPIRVARSYSDLRSPLRTECPRIFLTSIVFQPLCGFVQRHSIESDKTYTTRRIGLRFDHDWFDRVLPMSPDRRQFVAVAPP